MNREMLMLVDAISREKNVERDIVLVPLSWHLRKQLKSYTKAM